MSTPTIEAMAERLERLERENRLLARRVRRMRLAGLIALVAAAVATAAGARQEKRRELEAQGFILRDADGNFRGGLINQDGLYSVLQLCDADQRIRLQGGVSREGHTTLSLLDAAGDSRISMNEDPGRGSSVELYGPRGRPRISLNILRKPGGASLMLYDRKGTQRIDVEVPDEGVPVAAFFDEQGKRVVDTLGVAK